MSYYVAGLRKPLGLGIFKTVLIKDYVCPDYAAGGIEIEISSYYLDKVLLAIAQCSLSGYNLACSNNSGRAFKLMVYACTSGDQPLAESGITTGFSGTKLDLLVFGQ